MKCALCLAEKETVPVKLNLPRIQGPKDEIFNICKECLDLAHQAYLEKDFLIVKGGTNAPPHGAYGGAQDSIPDRVRRHMWTRKVDEYIFLKNGYSIMVHLVPFAIACLLLLITSLPPDNQTASLSDDNLLSKLSHVLDEYNVFWWPTGILITISSIIYFLTLRLQVTEAYLWSKNNNKRIVVTGITFILLCAVSAYLVLALAPPTTITSLDDSQSNNSLLSDNQSVDNPSATENEDILTRLKRNLSLGKIGACLLLALISLIGIGWNMLGSLAESVGIESPDYSESHLKVKEIAEILKINRDKDKSDVDDVKHFKKIAEELHSNLEENMKIEPEWAKDELKVPIELLQDLIDAVQREFLDTKQAINFAVACQFKKDPQYPDFVKSLRSLSNLWNEWSGSK